MQSSHFSPKYRKKHRNDTENSSRVEAQNGNKNSCTLGLLSLEGRKVQKIPKVISINKVKTTADSNRQIQRH